MRSAQEESGAGDSCDDFTDLNLTHCFMGTRLYVRLLLYTRANLDCGRELDHHRPSAQPLFNVSRPTAFVIHGYRPTGAPPIWINHIVHLLAQQEDMNLIVVDWNKGAANLNYLTAVSYTREAAYNLTGFIITMQVRSSGRIGPTASLWGFLASLSTSHYVFFCLEEKLICPEYT